MLERDVANLRNFFGRFAPEILATNYGDEIWATYQSGTLTSDSMLTGSLVREEKDVDLAGVVREIGDAEREEAARVLRTQA
jgi:RIO kinase 1